MGLRSCRPAKKPLLNKRMKQARLEWCKGRKNWTLEDWKRIIFSDESKFNLFGPNATLRVRRRTGERYSDECIQATVKHSPYVMVWGCVLNNHVGPLIILEGSVNLAKYRENCSSSYSNRRSNDGCVKSSLPRRFGSFILSSLCNTIQGAARDRVIAVARKQSRLESH